MIEKLIGMVPTLLGRGVDEKSIPVYNYYTFQRDVEALVEAADYAQPKFELPPLGYDFVHDEYYILEVPEEKPDALPGIIAGFFGGLVAVHLLRTLLTVKWRSLGRRAITLHLGSAIPTPTNYRSFRSAFNTTEVFKPHTLKNHNHGVAAGARLSAIQFMNAVCTATGMTRYSFQMSSSEQSRNVPGERMYYWAKDISAEPQFDVATDSNIITLIDVDYYVDMNDHLADTAKPHMLYTVQPETAGRVGIEYSYTFNALGQLCWRVAGGAYYQHHVWNYGTDSFLAVRRFLGIPYKTVLFDVQTQRHTPDKALVLLSPIRTFYGIAAFLSLFMAKPLTRLNPVVGKYSKVVSYSPEGKFVSVAPQGSETSSTVAGALFDGLIATRNNSPKQQVNNFQVKSMLPKAKSESEEAITKDIVGPLLTEYLNNAPDRIVDPIVIVDIPRITQMAFAVPDPTDKPSMEAFAAPFGVPPGFVAVRNKASGDQAVIGRVLLPREQAINLLGEFKMTQLKQTALDEFVRRLVPDAHVGVPCDFDAIAERQIKPGQKRDLLNAGNIGPYISNVIKAFMKGEVYGKPTDTRNISTFNAKAKITYAAYMYPIMDHLKQFPFYAFGQSPKKVAERVAHICKTSNVVQCPDLHRMDGWVNYFCRTIEEAVGLRFFQLEYAEGFRAAHAESFDNAGVTSDGFRYTQGPSRGSGEMGTSAWNTVIDLFIVFYALVLSGHSFDAAWLELLDRVMAGGDDSIVGDVTDTILVRAARDIGFIMKCPGYNRATHDYGVNFLARVYGPDVWNGDSSSMCSLRRQMEKFHVTPSVPLSPAQKLFEKALSFASTDINTPVIGQLCKAVANALPGTVTTNTITRWGDDVDVEERYPNTYGQWMDRVAEEELPLTNVADLISWLESLPPIAELLACPVFYQQGREFTYDEWDPYPGMLIKRTLEILGAKKSKKKTGVSIADIRFGPEGEMGGPADDGSSASKE
jgi:hypothetical protein